MQSQCAGASQVMVKRLFAEKGFALPMIEEKLFSTQKFFLFPPTEPQRGDVILRATTDKERVYTYPVYTQLNVSSAQSREGLLLQSLPIF